MGQTHDADAPKTPSAEPGTLFVQYEACGKISSPAIPSLSTMVGSSCVWSTAFVAKAEVIQEAARETRSVFTFRRTAYALLRPRRGQAGLALGLGQNLDYVALFVREALFSSCETFRSGASDPVISKIETPMPSTTLNDHRVGCGHGRAWRSGVEFSQSVPIMQRSILGWPAGINVR